MRPRSGRWLKSTRALAIDLSRLFAGVLRPTPRGIDRVEHLYARHFFSSWRGPCFAALPTPWGMRLFSREQALRGIAAVEARWGEGDNRGVHSLHAVARVGALLGKAAHAGLPEGALYLNVGHVGLASAAGRRWLERRRGVAAVVMLHDLIPVEHPELISPAERRYFGRILASVRHADGLILTTETVARSVERHLPSLSARRLVSPLPVPPAFLGPAPARTGDGPAYFVSCGQVERRKNHRLLVEVWRRLGPDAPRLLIVGGPGDASRALAAELDAWDPKRRRVEVLRAVRTDRLVELIAGARALLAPSLAEGFDLPVVEALALGTPVIASDIPVHREVAGERAVYVGVDDAECWAAAVRGADELEDAAAAQSRCAGYSPRAEADYFSVTDLFLAGFGS